MRFVRLSVFVCVLLFAPSAAFLAGQELVHPAPAWGTTSYGIRTIKGTAFRPIQSDTTFSQNSVNTHFFRTGGQLFFDYALADLPAGALITGLELDACDTSPTEEFRVAFMRRTSPSGPNLSVFGVESGVVETPGCGFFGSNTNMAGLGEIVDNFNRTYWLRLTLEAASDVTSLGTARLFYQLRVSPAPAVATFNDVPTSHPFFQFVEALAASGITAGCGGGNFCPDAPLTRKQMAAFLSIALGLHFPY